MTLRVLHFDTMTIENCLSLHVKRICLVDNDRIGKIDQEILSDGVRKTDCVDLLSCLCVRDDDGDEILCHMTVPAPVLSESENEVRRGSVRMDESVVL